MQFPPCVFLKNLLKQKGCDFLPPRTANKAGNEQNIELSSGLEVEKEKEKYLQGMNLVVATPIMKESRLSKRDTCGRDSMKYSPLRRYCEASPEDGVLTDGTPVLLKAAATSTNCSLESALQLSSYDL